jgi:hypothetical protein
LFFCSIWLGLCRLANGYRSRRLFWKLTATPK